MSHLTPEERRIKNAEFDAYAKSTGHIFVHKAIGIVDEALCTCGWRGTPINDNSFFCREEWEKHVDKESGNGQIVMNFF